MRVSPYSAFDSPFSVVSVTFHSKLFRLPVCKAHSLLFRKIPAESIVLLFREINFSQKEKARASCIRAFGKQIEISDCLLSGNYRISHPHKRSGNLHSPIVYEIEIPGRGVFGHACGNSIALHGGFSGDPSGLIV